jgi:nitrous oxide reductase accessory protein NosL
MKNISIFLVAVAIFLMSGCAENTAATKSMVHKVRFQTVSADKAQLLQSGKEKSACAICGMHLPTFYKTNHVADTKDTLKQYCSLHCVVHDNEINKTDLRNLRVVDTNSLKFIDALKAYYVVGSSKKGTMSRVSKYAFATKKEAEAFAKAYGGKVMKFYDAYDVAKKDF